MSERNIFLVLSGPSGVGKTSFIEKVLREYSHFQKLISYTTRTPRSQDEPGKSYYFISKEEFKKKQEEGAFVEWAEIYGDWYATGRNQVFQAWEQGKSIIKDLDIQGGEAIKKAFPQEAVTVFLYPPSLFELKQRLSKRGTEVEKDLKKRLNEAENEIAKAQDYDFKIVNDRFEPAWQEFQKIIEKL